MRAVVVMITLYFSCLLLYSQKTHHLEPFATPIIYQLGNINNQFTELENEHIGANYVNHPSFELGVQYRQKINEKWGWSAGLNYQKTTYELKYLELWVPLQENHSGDDLQEPSWSFNKKVQLDYFGLRLGLDYHFTDRIILGLYINGFNNNTFKRDPDANISQSVGSGGTSGEPDSTFTPISFLYRTNIEDQFSVPVIFPEVNAEFELFKNFYFSIGFRWKFWKSKYETVFTTSVEGYTNFEDQEIRPLHYSEARTRGFYVFSGIKYSIPLRKKTER